MGNRLDFSGVYSSDGKLLEDNQFTYEYDTRDNRTKKTAKDGTTIETYGYNDVARLVSYQRERIYLIDIGNGETQTQSQIEAKRPPFYFYQFTE